MTKRYDTYKDSGVQWLGEIPGHWKTMRSKFLLRLQTNSSKRPNKIGLENIEGFTGRYLSTDSTFEGDGVDFDKGDIVYGKLRPYLCKVWLAEFDGNAVGDFYVYRTSEEYFNEYAKYFMMSNLFTDICNASTYGAKMPRVSSQFIQSLQIPLPPLSEQHSIVSYLDDKCVKIDKMLEGKQKQIELLAEMKQRIIADAVTRGLNPDVKMKTTNIPWLPEIPEHWGEQRMASLFSGDIEVNKDFEFKKAFKFNYGQLVPKNEIGDPEEYREVYVKYSKIKQGDILVNGLNLNYDFISQRVACAPSEGIITSAYVVCRPREGVNYDYYTFLFKSMDSMKLFHGMGTGIRLTLSFKEMKKQILPIPPKEEQRAIVSYITEKTTKIDTLAAKLQQEIESIKEYKQRLISDVVTGQIKVC
ncbi:MAG: restriction endonuclease subunit S [Bacteroidia bacterium]|nr:restriction endonuclease subunit S [Bacteroidia bacterium]